MNQVWLGLLYRMMGLPQLGKGLWPSRVSRLKVLPPSMETDTQVLRNQKRGSNSCGYGIAFYNNGFGAKWRRGFGRNKRP